MSKSKMSMGAAVLAAFGGVVLYQTFAGGLPMTDKPDRSVTGSGCVKPLPKGIKPGSGWGDDRGDHSHGGQDFPAGRGTPIYAVKAGTVTVADKGQWDPNGYGWVVEVYHGGKPKTWTRYAHVDSIVVSKGQKVAAGQKIATVGNRGDSQGYHLHLEVLKGGRNVGDKVNPKPWLIGCGAYRPSDF